MFGTFLSWSFDLLVINGAFVLSTARSLCIAAMQPVTILLLTSIFIVKINPSITYAAILGFLMLAITTVFLMKFKRFKTKGIGVSSLQTFQSFLKSWVSQMPTDLENYFSRYSHEEPVITKVVLAKGKSTAVLVLPGVHPGPFYPVGSYNISELIFHELRKNGTTPMVLHGVGGHERNLPTNDLAKQYSRTIAEATAPSGAGREVGRMRGPNKLKLGPITVTTMGFGNQIITFLSSAPYNTDDLDPRTIDDATSFARGAAIDLMLVDSHNSIGGKNSEQATIDWTRVFSDIKGSAESEFEVGVAHSSELKFEHGSDISDGGITALVFRKQESTYALITSDSNNAVVGLRQTICDELRKENVELIELCTSDTHNSAARSLTTRGYHALGEDTDWAVLLSTIKNLERLAEERLSSGKVTVITSEVTLPLIGDKSLDDFATLTKETLDFTKTYAVGALASALALCSLALFL